MKQHTIWQNYDVNIEDYKDFLEEEHPDVTDKYEMQRLCNELNDSYLDDERLNLETITLDEDVVIIASLGRWNGRRMGYKIKSADNVGELLYADDGCDYAHWYVDRYGNLRCEESHHDGTNYLTYRMWKPNLSDVQKENFLNLVYEGKAASRDISRYTISLGRQVAEVYGWN